MDNAKSILLVLSLILTTCALNGCSPASSKEITLLAVGDVMLGREVNPQKAFTKIHDFLMDSDGVYINFEGVISDNYSVPRDPNEMPPKLFFSPSVAKILRENNVKFASVANNHGLDSGTGDLNKTRLLLQENNISAIGDPEKIAGDYVVESPLRGDQKIVWIGINMIHNSIQEKALIDLIKKYASDPNAIIFVCVHWGTEYNSKPDPVQIKFARLFIDSGADAVIGSHPHVVEPIETYKGKPIFYSLGNFVFDQVPLVTRKSVAIKFHIPNSANSEMTYDLIPINIVNNAPELDQ